MEFNAKTIAEFIDGEIIGNQDAIVNNVSSITDASIGDLSFVSNIKYQHFLYTTKASIVIISKDLKIDNDVPTTIIKVKDPYFAFAKLLQVYNSAINPPKEGISDKCSIDKSATIGENPYIGDYVVIGKNVKIGNNVQIYPNCYVGDNATIGNNTILYPSVVMYYKTHVGNNCTLHSGTVIGSDGFGFAPQSESTYEKIPQVGNVIIEDDTEIGANTVIDRATLGSTIIRRGVKLDNLIQVAHNVEIGENTVIAAQTGVAGSSKLGKNMMIGGQVGFAGHISIADDVKIAAQSGIAADVSEKGAIIMGSPAFDIKQYKRSLIYFKNLDKLNSKIKELEIEINNLKKHL